jgi:hypothetical protein
MPYLVVGEAQHAVAEVLQLRILRPVGLECDSVSVIPVAIGLDDHALLGPEEVHLETPDAHIHLWLGKAVPTAESKEEALELAAGHVRFLLEIPIRNQTEIECPPDCPPVDG